MPSMRPSQYAMQQRVDGGPFLRFDNGEARGLSEGELEALESGEYDENDFYDPTLVFYSDVPLPDNGSGWHLLSMVAVEQHFPIILRMHQIPPNLRSRC